MKRLPGLSRTRPRPRACTHRAPTAHRAARHRVEPLESRLLLSAAPATLDVPDVPGAFARFYNNTTLSGDPVATRVDPNIDFDFGTSSPAPGVNADGFSVRWSGRLRVPVSGSYDFITSADDDASLCAEGRTVVTNTARAPTLPIQHLSTRAAPTCCTSRSLNKWTGSPARRASSSPTAPTTRPATSSGARRRPRTGCRLTSAACPPLPRIAHRAVNVAQRVTPLTGEERSFDPPPDLKMMGNRVVATLRETVQPGRPGPGPLV